MSRPAGPQLPHAYGTSIGVETARRVAAAAIAEGKRAGWTVAVAIVDPGGDLVFFERIDDTQAAGSQLAHDKARTATRFKRSTKVLEDGLAAGRHAILGLPGAIPLEGGLPLVVDGKIIGAIGVSGATSQQDGVCAQAGVDQLAALAAQPS
jgi:glc operon protein GlcG